MNRHNCDNASIYVCHGGHKLVIIRQTQQINEHKPPSAVRRLLEPADDAHCVACGETGGVVDFFSL